MRVAVAGHAQCELPCADLAGQGIAPDRILGAPLCEGRADLSGQAEWPARLALHGRPRCARLPSGDGRAQEAARYAELLGSQPALPVFARRLPGDAARRAGAYRSAFDRLPAPFGAAPAPAGIDASGIPGAAPGLGARTHYAFDSSGPAGTVRVIVIDNSAGSLEASDPHQNPAEPQRPWLRRRARRREAQGASRRSSSAAATSTRASPRG